MTLQITGEKGQGPAGEWGHKKMGCRAAKGRGPHEAGQNGGRGARKRKSSGKQTPGMGEKSTAGRRGRKAPEVGLSCTGEASGGETPEAGLWDTAEPQGRVAHGTEAQEKDSILQWKHEAEGPQRWGRRLKSVAWQSSQQH